MKKKLAFATVVVLTGVYAFVHIAVGEIMRSTGAPLSKKPHRKDAR